MSRLTVILFSILFVLSLTGCAYAQTRQRQSSSAERQSATPQRRTTSGRVVEAGSFPGADLGAKINAADRSLGSAPGEIVARGGGRITTQIVINANHKLRLMAGTYAPTTQGIPILLGPGASLEGEGWDSILLETTAHEMFTVVSGLANARRNGDPDSGITIRDIQIKGANPGFNSAQQAVSLGNCSNCLVDKVWINSTRAIGVQLGGAAEYGHFASNSRVVNCLFSHVGSQNLALVNGADIVFENNRFENPGQPGGPGSTVIDLEPNHPDDRLERIVIRNNFIDARKNPIQAGNGILIQSGSGTTRVGPILVENNTLYGGNNTPPNITNSLSNGIYTLGATMKDVTIRNNKVTRFGQSGLRVEGSNFVITDNVFTDVGGGGIYGFFMAIRNSRIENNVFIYTGVGPANGDVQIGPGFGNNIIRNNRFPFPPGVRVQ